jgi:Zn-dependent protease
MPLDGGRLLKAFSAAMNGLFACGICREIIG